MTTSIKHILVPTDFSPLAACCFRFALRLAAYKGVSVHLLHVAEGGSHFTLNSTGKVPGDPLEDELEDELTLKTLEKYRDQLAEMAGKESTGSVPVHYQVQVGDPEKIILKTILDNAIDLVVMGASGGNWLERLFVGSTTERVVQRAVCPVITLKRNIDELSQLRNIVIAFEPAENQSDVLKEIKKFQQLIGAHLHLLLVNMSRATESSEVSVDRLHHFVKFHGLENYTIHMYDDAKVEEGLFGFAQEIGADLLAFATHHQSRLLGVLSPHSGQNMILHATTPVWTYNPKVSAAKSTSEEDNYSCLL